MREIIWLKKKGFDNEGDTWTKILEGAELIEFFEDDADTIDKIETGEIQAAYLEINLEEKTAQYILFEQYPTPEDISNANIIHEDYFPCVMEWIQKVD